MEDDTDATCIDSVPVVLLVYQFLLVYCNERAATLSNGFFAA